MKNVSRWTIASAFLAAALGCGSKGAAPANPPPDGAASIAYASVTVAPGTDCPYGGIRVDMGIDTNRNGQLDSAEVTASEFVCNGAPGAPGASSIVRSIAEPPGTHCASGGVLIEVGLDVNRNSVLDPAEVTSTQYVCNGASVPAPASPSPSPVPIILVEGRATVTGQVESGDYLAANGGHADFFSFVTTVERTIVNAETVSPGIYLFLFTSGCLTTANVAEWGPCYVGRLGSPGSGLEVPLGGYVMMVEGDSAEPWVTRAYRVDLSLSKPPCLAAPAVVAGVPAVCSADAGSQVAFPLRVCTRCDQGTPTCRVSQPSGNSVVLEPVAEVCSPSGSCPAVDPASCSFVTIDCAFTVSTATGNLDLTVVTPDGPVRRVLTIVPVGSGGTCGAPTYCAPQVMQGAGSAADILFVVDDSGSMTDKQQALADNLSSFIDTLLASPVALDLHIGVTNTSIDDYNGRTAYGAAASPSGAPFPGPGGIPFPNGTIVAIDPDAFGTGLFGQFTWGIAYDPVHLVSTWGGTRIMSTGPDLARDFKANVHQGEWGSGKEQPLRAIRASLDASMGTTSANFGFIRSGARLGVVILTDEDDCSESAMTKHITSDGVCHAASPDSPYFDSLDGLVDFLDTTVGGVSGQPPVVAAISGFDATGNAVGCTGTTFNSAASPRRLGAFLDRLETAHPGRTMKASICQPFGGALASIAQMMVPQVYALKQSPGDYRMLVVRVAKAAGSVVLCSVEPSGSAGAVGADVVFTPASPGVDATVTFQNGCLLGVGDKIDVSILCRP